MDELERILAQIEGGEHTYLEPQIRVSYAELLEAARDPRAGKQWTRAVALYERGRDWPAVIRTCIRMALHSRNSEDSAFYWVDRAIKAARRSEDPADMHAPLAVRGELLLAFDRPQEAVEALRDAAALPGGESHRAALGTALVQAGHVDEGTSLLEEELAEAEGSGADPPRVLRLRLRLADAARRQGRTAAALAYLEDAAVMDVAAFDPEDAAQLMDRLGFVLLESGDPARAADALERGLAAAQTLDPPERGLLASLFHNLGNALAALGNRTGAVRALETAAGISREIGALRTEARARFALANVAAQVDALDLAEGAYEEARALAVRLGDVTMEAACLDSLGQLAARAGAPARAVDLHRRAAELHAREGDARARHTDLLNLVQAYLLLDEVSSARRALDGASRIAQETLERVPWHHPLSEGRVLAREGRWQDARAAFETAIETLEGERATLETPSEQRNWATRSVEAFEIATTHAFEAGDAASALQFLEGNRTRFLEAVSEDRRRMPAGLEPELARAHAAAAHRRAHLRWSLRQRPDAPDPTLIAELRSVERTWRGLEDRVETARLSEDRRSDGPDPRRSVHDLAERLTPGEAAVALHVSSDWTGVACVGRSQDGGLWWSCATDPSLTLPDLSVLVLGESEPDAGATLPWRALADAEEGDAVALVDRTCRMLADSIWPLVESVTDGRADALVLMPGRGLNVLPLHAAVTGDGRRAFERWNVRYAPSLSLLADAGPPGHLPAARVLAQVVNPTGDLPLAPAECLAVSRSWGGTHLDLLVGADATPDALVDCFARADALHFAGHASFDSDDPLRSHLHCAGPPESSHLTLQSLLEAVQDARARLVLLSACETGRVQAGDPLNDQLGLPGGLLTAGVSAVLATFWHVDDLASSLVVSRCMAGFERGGCDLERALADAQVWLREHATVDAVRAWIEAQIEASPDAATPRLLEFLDLVYAEPDGSALLFSDALFWAPFHVVGRALRT